MLLSKPVSPSVALLKQVPTLAGVISATVGTGAGAGFGAEPPAEASASQGLPGLQGLPDLGGAAPIRFTLASVLSSTDTAAAGELRPARLEGCGSGGGGGTRDAVPVHESPLVVLSRKIMDNLRNADQQHYLDFLACAAKAEATLFTKRCDGERASQLMFGGPSCVRTFVPLTYDTDVKSNDGGVYLLGSTHLNAAPLPACVAVQVAGCLHFITPGCLRPVGKGDGFWVEKAWTGSDWLPLSPGGPCICLTPLPSALCVRVRTAVMVVANMAPVTPAAAAAVAEAGEAPSALPATPKGTPMTPEHLQLPGTTSAARMDRVPDPTWVAVNNGAPISFGGKDRPYTARVLCKVGFNKPTVRVDFDGITVATVELGLHWRDVCLLPDTAAAASLSHATVVGYCKSCSSCDASASVPAADPAPKRIVQPVGPGCPSAGTVLLPYGRPVEAAVPPTTASSRRQNIVLVDHIVVELCFMPGARAAPPSCFDALVRLTASPTSERMVRVRIGSDTKPGDVVGTKHGVRLTYDGTGVAGSNTVQVKVEAALSSTLIFRCSRGAFVRVLSLQVNDDKQVVTRDALFARGGSGCGGDHDERPLTAAKFCFLDGDFVVRGDVATTCIPNGVLASFTCGPVRAWVPSAMHQAQAAHFAFQAVASFGSAVHEARDAAQAHLPTLMRCLGVPSKADPPPLSSASSASAPLPLPPRGTSSPTRFLFVTLAQRCAASTQYCGTTAMVQNSGVSSSYALEWTHVVSAAAAHGVDLPKFERSTIQFPVVVLPQGTLLCNNAACPARIAVVKFRDAVNEVLRLFDPIRKAVDNVRRGYLYGLPQQQQSAETLPYTPFLQARTVMNLLGLDAMRRVLTQCAIVAGRAQTSRAPVLYTGFSRHKDVAVPTEAKEDDKVAPHRAHTPVQVAAGAVNPFVEGMDAFVTASTGGAPSLTRASCIATDLLCTSFMQRTCDGRGGVAAVLQVVPGATPYLLDALSAPVAAAASKVEALWCQVVTFMVGPPVDPVHGTVPTRLFADLAHNAHAVMDALSVDLDTGLQSVLVTLDTAAHGHLKSFLAVIAAQIDSARAEHGRVVARTSGVPIGATAHLPLDVIPFECPYCHASNEDGMRLTADFSGVNTSSGGGGGGDSAGEGMADFAAKSAECASPRILSSGGAGTPGAPTPTQAFASGSHLELGAFQRLRRRSLSSTASGSGRDSSGLLRPLVSPHTDEFEVPDLHCFAGERFMVDPITGSVVCANRRCLAVLHECMVATDNDSNECFAQDSGHREKSEKNVRTSKAPMHTTMVMLPTEYDDPKARARLSSLRTAMSVVSALADSGGEVVDAVEHGRTRKSTRVQQLDAVQVIVDDLTTLLRPGPAGVSMLQQYKWLRFADTLGHKTEYLFGLTLLALGERLVPQVATHYVTCITCKVTHAVGEGKPRHVCKPVAVDAHQRQCRAADIASRKRRRVADLDLFTGEESAEDLLGVGSAGSRGGVFARPAPLSRSHSHSEQPSLSPPGPT